MNKFKPDYSVAFNRDTGSRAVIVGKDVVYVHTVQAGTKRNFYCHYKTGRQSALYPTLRDCIINIVYGV